MTLVRLDLIEENGHNLRRRHATAEQDAELEKSIAALGVLQPVLLRRNMETADRYFIVAGHRRVRCARSAALNEIPAEIIRSESDGTYAAIQAAENMVRVPMAPVDQWHAIVALQDAGYSLSNAAAALGLSERRAKQLDKLGHIDQQVLDLIADNQHIDFDDIARIASAPIERQKRAFKETEQYFLADDRLEIMARHCAGTRIRRSFAIFEVDSSNVRFDEDLFAEPGSDDQFTTDDIEGFLTAQKAALVESVNARKKKNERVTLADWTKNGIKLPKGWDESHAPIKKRYPAKGIEMLFVAVREDGYDMGAIKEVAAVNRAEAKAREKTKAAAKPEDDEAAEADLDEPRECSAAEAEEAAFEEALTKRGQTMLAAMKSDALHDRLDPSDGGYLALEIVLSALIVALAGRNVSVTGANRYGRVDFDDLVARIVTPGGMFLDLPESDLAALGAAALSRMLHVTDPVTGHGSGEPAEWIGAAIGAEVALSRFDTAEFLACMSKTALADLAAQNGRAGLKTASGLREALAGNLPDWRPTTFGAPGPRLDPIHSDEEEDEAA